MRTPRFLLLAQVAEELATTQAQVYALVRSGALPAIKLGSRGQGRVERAKLEAYIEELYAETAAFVREHPWPADRGGPGRESPDGAIGPGPLPG